MVVDAVRAFLNPLPERPCRILAAVSGGVDSTALLVALARLREEGFDIVAGHVNHKLRGAEAEADEEFVRTLCAGLEIPLETAAGPLDSELVRARGTEAAAREVRYALLLSMRDRHSAHYLATAHQKNDQAETVLMRLISGGGIAALRAIRPMREDRVIRPLLSVTRAEIEEFLRERSVAFRRDSSNLDRRFLRNRVRQFVVEAGAVDTLAALADQARSLWPHVETVIDEAERSHLHIGPANAAFHRVPDDPWLRQALLHRHIRRLDPEARDVSARDLMRLAGEMRAVRRISVTRSLELVRRGDSLVLRRRPEPVSSFELELTAESPAWIPELGLTVAIAPVREPTDPDRQRIEIHSPSPRFVVRNRREGDRFQPLGMKGSKKLKDFLIDRKIAAEDRDRLPLLVVDGQIAWIAGVEVSERFKVSGRQGSLYEVWTEHDRAADEQRNLSPLSG